MSGVVREETIGPCRLIQGDCLEVLPLIGRVDAVVTDPPYGIGFEYAGEYIDVGGDDYMRLLSPFSAIPRAMLQYPEEMMQYMVPLWGAPNDVFAWCYNSNTNRQIRLWGFWGIKPNWNAVKQPCKNPGDSRVSREVRIYDWCSDLQQVKNVSQEKTDHPCQIPSDLVCRVLGLTDRKIILDPFMGSGTTGVACIKTGRNFIGIEREPKYFDIAVKRIKRAWQEWQSRIPFEDEPKWKQESLFLDEEKS